MQSILRVATLNQFAVFESGRALGLEPARIPKPWGQEVWFTGVEERGVCLFHRWSAQLPIPWVQAAAPGAFAGSPAEPLVLLKILDPVAQEVVGDLYFELHEEKREVYVVTHIDPEAWPDASEVFVMASTSIVWPSLTVTRLFGAITLRLFRL